MYIINMCEHVCNNNKKIRAINLRESGEEMRGVGEGWRYVNTVLGYEILRK
jgi:5-deoxy-D-glucuronate isomerase